MVEAAVEVVGEAATSGTECAWKMAVAVVEEEAVEAGELKVLAAEILFQWQDLNCMFGLEQRIPKDVPQVPL